jgi:ATP-binding cassette subfamily B protein
MTIVNAVLRIVRSATPLALLYVGKLIIDDVIALTHIHKAPDTHLWQLVGLEFGLAILTDALTRVITLVDSLLGDLFSNHTSVKIMEHAATRPAANCGANHIALAGDEPGAGFNYHGFPGSGFNGF